MSAVLSGPPCKQETQKVLVVEGKDDCYGIYQIAAKSGLSSLFGIWEGGSDEGALQRFGGLLASRERPTILGIVLDCDGRGDGVRQRWDQVEARLRDMPYHLPAGPNSQGTIIESRAGFPRIGVWLMPDNQTEGMFEDFLLALVPSRALAFVQQTTRAARMQGHATYKQVHESKAVAHTYLAWQEEPGKPFGTAIKAGMFDLETPTGSAFIAWLRDLFQPAFN